MSRKNIVRNGVFGMEDCAEAVRAHFAAEGYQTQKLIIDDLDTTGMLVQVCNTSEKSGFFKKAVGLGTCATLKLVARGSNLELEVLGGKWLDKVAAGTVSLFVLWPLFVTAGIGMWRQSKLLDDVFAEAMAYFVKNVPSRTDKFRAAAKTAAAVLSVGGTLAGIPSPSDV